MPDRILVINPNSTNAVTHAIDEAMAPLRIPGGPEVGLTPLERVVDRGVSVEAFALAAAGSRLNDSIRGTHVRAE